MQTIPFTQHELDVLAAIFGMDKYRYALSDLGDEVAEHRDSAIKKVLDAQAVAYA